MKYKRGKGRKCRRQVRAFCMKKGGGKFSFKGGTRLSPWGNPVPVGLSSSDRVKTNLRSLGFNVQGGDK